MDVSKGWILVALVLMLILMVSCVPGPNPQANTPDEAGKVDGFWQGLWHGLITPITFIISLFSDKVHMYEVHNNGGWYNFGFVIGAGLFLQGGILGGRKACKRRG